LGFSEKEREGEGERERERESRKQMKIISKKDTEGCDQKTDCFRWCTAKLREMFSLIQEQQ